MSTPLKHIALFAKHSLLEDQSVVFSIADALRRLACTVYVHQDLLQCPSLRHFPTLSEASSLDAAVVAGGDGTLLRTLRELPERSLPLLGINMGRVGFLSELTLDELHEALPIFVRGEAYVEERLLLQVQVVRDGAVAFEGVALNEAAMSQGAIARLFDVRTSVNGEYLATYHADGLIVATPTGSTAYSLAAGGPVVHPALSAMILTPINPHSMTQKPIVLPATDIVEARMIQEHGDETINRLSLTLDGQIYTELRHDDRVVLQSAPEPARFLRKSSQHFFHAIRTKLKWGERI